MKHLLFGAICVLTLLVCVRSTSAQTVEQLRERLAAEQARNADLMRRIEALEQQLLAREALVAPPPDDASNRALERALVRDGGSLLPAYRLEVEPGLAWVHSDPDDALRLNDAIDASLGLRFGLPGGFQIGAYAPYSIQTEYDGRTAHGIRDISGQLSKQLVAVRGGRPGVIVDFGWSTPTGQTAAGRVPLGNGFDIGRGRVTVVKVAEPLVFVAQGAYSRARERIINGAAIQLGDTIGARAGTTLAATPGVSLFLGVNVLREADARRAGIRLDDSGEVVGFFETNLGIVLSRRTFLNLGATFGVTGNGRPDTVFDVSLPVRF
jgi:hypothetical protein